MWTDKRPTESGYYWFYGDPFWDQLPHDELKGINPFKPEMMVMEVQFIRESFIMYVTAGAMCYGMRGVFWDERIESPPMPEV